jgi:hypothetical protein
VDSSTTMFPVMSESSDSTLDWAPVSEHGKPLEHVLPEPAGEAYNVVVAPADASGTDNTDPTPVKANEPRKMESNTRSGLG